MNSCRSAVTKRKQAHAENEEYPLYDADVHCLFIGGYAGIEEVYCVRVGFENMC